MGFFIKIDSMIARLLMNVLFSFFSRRKHSSDQKFFFLIELFLVLAIMGITRAGGGVGLLNQLPEYRLKSSARDLFSHLQKTRIEAVKRSLSCRLVFDVNNSKYAISVDNGPDGIWSTIGDNVNLSIVSLDEYESGVGYGSGAAAFDATVSKGVIPGDHVSYNANISTYNSRGTSSSGYVYLDNQKGDAFAVGTSSLGTIRIFRWDGTDWS